MVSWMRLHCARNQAAIGEHARDRSTFPLFLLHPARRQQEFFTLVVLFTADSLQLDKVRILSLDHFYDAFRTVSVMSLRTAVLNKFGLKPEVLSHDLRISKQTAAAACRPDVRDLLPEEEDVLSDGDSNPDSSHKTPRNVRDTDGDTAQSNGS